MFHVLAFAVSAMLEATGLASSACGASSLDFDTPDAWKFVNYRNCLAIDSSAVEDGMKCLAVHGATQSCDTAFAALSRKIAVPPGTREFVVSVETKGSKLVVDQISPSGNWQNKITWFDSAGKELGTQNMSHIAVAASRRFVMMREWGRIPDGAAYCTVRLAFDSPDLAKDETVCYRAFSFEAVPAGISRADEFEAVWKDASWIRDLLYPPPKNTVPKATLRDDGMTLIDGEPFFPIGMYSVCRREFNGNNFESSSRSFLDRRYTYY